MRTRENEDYNYDEDTGWTPNVELLQRFESAMDEIANANESTLEAALIRIQHWDKYLTGILVEQITRDKDFSEYYPVEVQFEMLQHAKEVGYFRQTDLILLPYKDFLYTPYWQITRKYILHITGGRCAICATSRLVDVHHRTYEHHGLEDEYLDDLVVLCRDCHSKFHDKLPEVPNGNGLGQTT